MWTRPVLQAVLIALVGVQIGCPGDDGGGSGEGGDASDAGAAGGAAGHGSDGTGGAQRVIAITAATEYSCALIEDGSVRCWGNNHLGQVSGDAKGELLGEPLPPTTVPGLSEVEQLSAGGAHTCAVKSGKVFCWGSNRAGESTGDATGSEQVAVSQVVGVSDAIQVAAGYVHSCALSSDGSVRCWGDYTSVMPLAEVTLIEGVTEAVQIAAGYGHSCALSRDGSVRCWGDNANGQSSGDAARTMTAPVTSIPVLTGVTQISALWQRSCALADGAVMCWGSSGMGVNSRVQVVPELAAGIESLAPGAGAEFECALANGGGARCFGLNHRGQVTGDGQASGRGDTPESYLPVTTVAGLANAKQLALGDRHACALLENGSVRCWGDDDRGQSTGNKGGGALVAVSPVSGL
jgi:alpha-tubulin suppressor-like RCC1 family protein